jgi:4-hydroxy-2-oxoheptanedioate aldolase
LRGRHDRPAGRLRSNSLRTKLEARDFVLGTFLEIPSPALVELLGLAGFDFVVIDREHGAIGVSDTEDLIRASLTTDISAMVRVPMCESSAIRQPLDMGAAGLHIPQIDSAQMAAHAIQSSKYFPNGNRGLQPFVRSASYRNYATSEYLAESNRESLIVAQVEAGDGVLSVESILAVEGVDVVFIGPYDLSQSLGVPGDVAHPKVREAMAETASLCRAAGKWAGTFCDDPETAIHYRNLGFSYLTVSIDAFIFLSAARSIVQRAGSAA